MEKAKKFEAAFSVNKDEGGFVNATKYKYVKAQCDEVKYELVYQPMCFSEQTSTFRGLHFQTAPFEQNKPLIVHSERIEDDLLVLKGPRRSDAIEFDLTLGDVLCIPNTYAHEFLKLTDGVLLQHLMDNDFSPRTYTGFFGLDIIEKYVSPETCMVLEKDTNLQRVIQ